MCYRPDFGAYEQAICKALMDLYEIWAELERECDDAEGLEETAYVERFFVDMLKRINWLREHEEKRRQARQAAADAAGCRKGMERAGTGEDGSGGDHRPAGQAEHR